MTNYPTAEDYVQALQVQQHSLQISALHSAIFALHPVFGIPMPASGQAAVVFKVHAEGTDQAWRFFLKDVVGGRQRYTALARYFAEHDLIDCGATAAWVDDAITVRWQTWPMVRMEWIEGRTLDTYVEYLAEQNNAEALYLLAGSWRERVRRLQSAGFAHGDLQHGNVIVDTSRQLRLVDFDGSWIPGLEGVPAPAELTHPNYQRADVTWGRWMDTFPALVIYTALTVLSRRPQVWQTLSTGENMIFSREDLTPPFATEVWRRVAEVDDAEVQHVLGRLRRCCDPKWKPDRSLSEMLDRDQITLMRPAAEETPQPTSDGGARHGGR